MRAWKYYAILSTLILLGFLCIVFSSTLAPPPSPLIPNQVPSVPKWWESWPKWLETIGTTLLIAGSLGVIEKAFLSTETKRELQHLFGVHESTSQLGLEKVSINAGNYDYKELIETSPLLRIVMYDARTWVSSRIDQFQVRFANPQFETEVYLVDPDSEFTKILAQKTGYSLEAQKNKISEATSRFIDEFKKLGSKGKLTIYYLSYYPTHSIVMGTTNAVLTLYGISTGRRAVPTFQICETAYDKDLFSDIKTDIDRLRM